MKSNFKNALAILLPSEKRTFYTLVIFTLIITLVDIGSLALLIFIINFYTDQSAFIPTWLPEWLINRNSVILIFIFLIFFSLKNLAGYYIHRAQYNFVYSIASRLSEKQLFRFLEGNFSNFVNEDSSVHTWKIAILPIEFSQYIMAGLQQVITELIMIVLVIIAILLFDPQLFFLLILVLLPPIFIMTLILKKKMGVVRKKIKESREKMWQYLQEAIYGYVESNIYDKHDFFANRYITKQEILNHHIKQMHIAQGIPPRLVEIFAVFGLFVLILVAKLLETDHVGIITLGAFMAAAYKLIPGIVKVINLSGQIYTYSFTIRELLGDASQSPEKTKEKRDKVSSILLKDLSFQFNNKMGIKRLNLELVPGDFLGIAGDSGVGKTTLINLLLGFLEPQSGEINVNNEKQTALSLKSFWNKIAYVKQEPFLIHDSILQNITLTENLPNKERFSTAIRIAGLEDFISQFENGENGIITEGGKNISGGQRKRIAIARAIYKDADLIILDEPFSELDDNSEIKIRDHFSELKKLGKMIIMITHKKEALNLCNKIIELNA